MTSLRHNGSFEHPTLDDPALDDPGPDDSVLDAARESILAVGWRRSTLTDVARRAGVSRMTIYRRWSQMQALVADLMTREWGRLVPAPDLTLDPVSQVASGVRGTVAALREDALFAKIVAVDPELLLPYLLDRRGRTQDALLAGLRATIEEGQRGGSIRTGDPTLLARSVLLAAHGFALSADTMTDADGPTTDDLDAELGHLVESYLAP